jgi:hypothetical protein
MSPILPGNIPVAAESLEALMKIGSPWVLRDKSQALGAGARISFPRMGPRFESVTSHQSKKGASRVLEAPVDF